MKLYKSFIIFQIMIITLLIINCTNTQIKLDKEITIQTIGLDEKFTTKNLIIKSDNQIYKLIQSELNAGTNNWETYYVTQIGKGIFIRSGSLNLQLFYGYIYCLIDNKRIVKKIRIATYLTILSLIEKLKKKDLTNGST